MNSSIGLSNDNGNGHEAHEGYSTLTLPDSGQTLEYRRVSHMLLADVQRSMKPPRPPMQEVDYGGVKKMEPNPAHPDYAEALAEHRTALAEKILEVAIQYGVICDVDKARVAELRAAMTEAGVNLPANDKVLYVTRILCETGNDLNTLRDAVIRKSQPTEGATAEAVARFPAEVPGS